MPSQLTTHQIDNKPILAWLTSDGASAATLGHSLPVDRFEHRVYSLDSLPPDWFRQLGSSYKIVIFVTSKQLVGQFAQIKSLTKKMAGKPLTFVMPILAELDSEELPTAWRQQYSFQNQILSQVLFEFPSTQLILLQEVVLPTQPWLLPSSLFLCLQDLYKLVLYSAPALPYPLSLSSALPEILKILSKPNSQQTHLFHSKQLIKELPKQVGQIYEQMYQVRVELNELTQSKLIHLGFITQEHSLEDLSSSNEVLTSLAQNIPSPTQDQTIPAWYNSASFKTPAPIRNEKINKTTLPQSIRPDSAKLAGEISNLFRTQRIKQKQSVITGLTQQEAVFRQKRRSRRWLFYGGLGFVGIGLGVLFLILVFWFNERVVRRQFASLMSEETILEAYDEPGWKKLLKNASLLNWQAKSYGQLVDSPIFEQSRQLTLAIEQWDGAQKSARGATEAGQKLALAVLGNNDGDVAESAANSLTTARQAYADLSKLEADMNQLLWLSEGQGDEADLGGWLNNLRQQVSLQQQVSLIFQTMANQPSKQRWLILFQNNQELRPTGGFIQAVSLITLDRAKLSSFSQYSSYQIDENLPGQVAPPEEIKQQLGENNWYFRDSNWDPNFPSSAAKSAWFVEKSLNTNVDGVLALTPSSLEQILVVVGPIDLPEFNEVVTDKNIAERLEFHSGIQLADSSNKPDYSALLLGKILSAIQNLSGDKIEELSSAIALGLGNQEILISPMNQSISNQLASLGWTGELLSPSCPSQFSTQNCLVDSIMQVESNVGVNKANAYLDRKISQSIVLDGQMANHTRSVVLDNLARTSAWPKGPYKSYIRFYLPLSAQLDSVSIDGKQLSQDLITSYTEHKKNVVGVSVMVDVSRQIELQIKYHLPLPIGKGSAYLFFDQKQPGRGKTEMNLDISYPAGLTVRAVAPQADFNQTKVVFNPNVLQSSFSGIQF